MSTLCESLRAKAVIVLLGIPLLSSSHAQELMGHSKFGTVLPQAVAGHLDPVAMFSTPPEVTYIDGLLTIGAHNAPLAAVLRSGGCARSGCRPDRICSRHPAPG
jgi:hypothetical protein